MEAGDGHHRLMGELIIESAGPAGVAGLAAAAVFVAFAGFLRGFVGFGAALIVVPTLSIIFTPALAVAVACLSGMPTVLQLLPDAIRHGERRFMLPFGLAAFLVAPVGTWALASSDPAPLRLVIALAVIAMALFLKSGARLPSNPGGGLLTLGGALAGLIQGVGGVGGPPAVALALARGGAAEAQRGNVIAAVMALALSTVAPLWTLGLFTQQALYLALLLTPIHVFFAWVGARYFARGGQKHFRNAALWALLAIGVFTLLGALRPYL